MALLSISEVTERLEKIEGWSLAGDSITKMFEFSSSEEATEFVDKVEEIAGHHPGIVINDNRVILTLPKHKEGGLTEKDFNLAGKIEKI